MKLIPSALICIIFFFYWLLWVLVAACRLSLVGESGGSSLVVHGLLIAMTPPVAEPRVQAHGLQQLWPPGSVVASHRLQSTGSLAVAYGLSCSMACGSSWTRDPSHVPTLAGGFLTTGPPGKSCIILMKLMLNSLVGILLSSGNNTE